MPSPEARIARSVAGGPRVNTLAPTRIRIRLFDPWKHPLPGAPFRLGLGSQSIVGHADGDAWLEVWVGEVPPTCLLEWGHPDEVVDGDGAPVVSDAPYRYQHPLHLLSDLEEDEEEASAQRLHNLGYLMGETLAHRILSYQVAYAEQTTGLLADVKSGLWDAHDTCAPDKWPGTGAGA